MYTNRATSLSRDIGTAYIVRCNIGLLLGENSSQLFQTGSCGMEWCIVRALNGNWTIAPEFFKLSTEICAFQCTFGQPTTNSPAPIVPKNVQ